jgi:phage/plasmid-like protein (TIGR03299 family)
MAHEIEMVNGVAQMAYVGALPWHGLGVALEEDCTPTEMMNAAGLNWTVEKQSLLTPTGLEIPGKQALIRTSDNKYMDIVGDDWNPVQNEEAFNFFSEFVEAGGMKMHTAGSLKEGKMVWALAKVEDDFELFNGDKVESFLLFSNPHAYGKSIDVRFTPIRVVCNNTLTLSLKGKADTGVRLNHRKQFNAEEVKVMMNLANAKMNTYKDMALFLGTKAVKRDVMKEYFGELLGGSKKEGKDLSRTAERAMELLDTQPGAEFAEGTMWSAFNAVTYFVDHEAGRSNDTRMQSAWYGHGAKLKTKALELALEYAA